MSLDFPSTEGRVLIIWFFLNTLPEWCKIRNNAKTAKVGMSSRTHTRNCDLNVDLKVSLKIPLDFVIWIIYSVSR